MGDYIASRGISQGEQSPTAETFKKIPDLKTAFVIRSYQTPTLKESV